MSARHLRRARAVADDYSFSNHGAHNGGKIGRSTLVTSGGRDFGLTRGHLRRQSLSLDSIPDAIIRQIHSARSESSSQHGSPRMREMADAGRERAMTISISPARSSARQSRLLFRNRTMEDPGISITVSEPENVDRLVPQTGTADPDRDESPRERSRSVNFFGGVEDNSDKKRLQRTPTPYWSRKEMGDASGDEDGIDYTPSYDPPDWDEGSGSLTTPGAGKRTGEDTGSSLESLTAPQDPGISLYTAGPGHLGGHSGRSETVDKFVQKPEVCSSQRRQEVRGHDDDLQNIPELFRNPLFRKVAGYRSEVSGPLD